MGEVVRIPNASTPNGRVFLDPVADDGGSWGVFHESRDRKSVSWLANRFGFTDATAEAERLATELGAYFDVEIGGTA